jgi:hypothetical protein
MQIMAQRASFRFVAGGGLPGTFERARHFAKRSPLFLLPTTGRAGTMDPITTAVVAALPALASDVVKSTVKDAYDALKEVIRRRWGERSPVARAVEALERDPTSEDRAQSLEERIADTKATQDPEVMKVLAKLAASLEKADIAGSASTQINLRIHGGNLQGVIGAQHVTVDKLTFGALQNDAGG